MYILWFLSRALVSFFLSPILSNTPVRSFLSWHSTRNVYRCEQQHNKINKGKRNRVQNKSAHLLFILFVCILRPSILFSILLSTDVIQFKAMGHSPSRFTENREESIDTQALRQVRKTLGFRVRKLRTQITE